MFVCLFVNKSNIVTFWVKYNKWISRVKLWPYCSEMFTACQYSDWLEVILFVKIGSWLLHRKFPKILKIPISHDWRSFWKKITSCLILHRFCPYLLSCQVSWGLDPDYRLGKLSNCQISWNFNTEKPSCLVEVLRSPGAFLVLQFFI